MPSTTSRFQLGEETQVPWACGRPRGEEAGTAVVHLLTCSGIVDARLSRVHADHTAARVPHRRVFLNPYETPSNVHNSVAGMAWERAPAGRTRSHAVAVAPRGLL